MKSTEEQVKEILSWFLYQTKSVSKMETEDGKIKVYKVGDDLVRVDIKSRGSSNRRRR